MAQGVYVFWDNSNIFIGAKHLPKFQGAFSHNIRIEFENLYKLAHANRVVKAAYAVGSIPPESKTVWNALVNKTGIVPELFERGAASGKEQAVDQALQVHILRALVDEDEPQTVVLLTGDGRGFDDGVGFHADLQRMKRKGWAIEVLSWDRTCASGLKQFAQSEGIFVPLDNFVDSIAFSAGGGSAKPLNLKGRKTAQPNRAQQVSLPKDSRS